MRPLLTLASLLLASASHAQPALDTLRALPGTMEGKPIVVSNNPESVSREGLLLGSDPMTPAVAGTVRRDLSNGTLDSACPAGSMREFAFYMHHLLARPSGSDAQVERVYVLLEPTGTSATFNAYGAAISQADYIGTQGSLDPGQSPSYSVSLASLTGTLPAWYSNSTANNGSRFVNLNQQTISGVFALANLRGNPGSSLDARIKVRATSGCLRVRVVAASAANGSVALANTLSKRAYAWGNVPTTATTVGGAPCTDANSIGWGRPAGIYQFERWAGSTAVDITQSTSTIGWKYLAAPPNQQLGTTCAMNPQTATPSSNSQRSNALRYYYTNTSGASEGRDSDPWSTANYGAEYSLAFRATNKTGRCVTARLQVTNYPGGRTCSASTSNMTRHYDGAFTITQNGVAQPLQRAFVKCNPADLKPVATIASKVLRASESVDWNIRTFVPGLISAPAAVLLDSQPATCP